LAPDDESRLRRFYDRLSPASRYSRFFSFRNATAQEVSRLIQADPDVTDTAVAEWQADIVGAASSCRNASDPDRAEVAFAVDDGRHGLGIGTHLLETLAD